jgi:hypothetical protein
MKTIRTTIAGSLLLILIGAVQPLADERHALSLDRCWESFKTNRHLEINYRALEVKPLENPSRLIKNENAFRSADELKLNRTETIAFSNE